jgi:hypothetical protein
MSFIWHTFKLDFCTLCGFVLNCVAQFFHVLHVCKNNLIFNLFSRFVFPRSFEPHSSLSREKVPTSRIHLSIKKERLDIYTRSELSNLMTKTKQLSTVNHFLCWIVPLKGCLASSMVADSGKLSHLSHTLRLAYWLTTLPCRLSHHAPVLQYIDDHTCRFDML